MTANYSPQIVTSALIDPFRVIKRYGGDTARFCQLAGIQKNELAETICLGKYARVSEVAAEQLRVPEFGWEVGADFDLRNIGDVGQFILEAPTLGAALSLFRKAFAMVQTDSDLSLSIEGDEAVLGYRILDPDIWPCRQDAELTLSVLHTLVKAAVGADWRPTLITVEHDTSTFWKNSAIGPRCPVQYNAQGNSLRFPVQLMDLPMSGTPTGHFKIMSNALSLEAMRREREAPTAIRVRREVARRLGKESLDQTKIAGALGFSRRTLRRRLKAEDRPFSGILSDCRARYAERMLRASDISLSLIADHLGYSEVSAFERAFKARQGMTPAQFRKVDDIA